MKGSVLATVLLLLCILGWSEHHASAREPIIQASATGTPTIGTASNLPSPLLKWKAKIRNNSFGPASDRLVYYASSASTLIAFDADTGQTVWKFEPEDISGFDSATTPVIAGDTVLFGFTDLEKSGHYPDSEDVFAGYLFALDVRTGNERWRIKVGEQVTTPAVAGGKVFFGTGQWTGKIGGYNDNPKGAIHAVDLATGKLEWELPFSDADIWETPVVSDGLLYFLDRPYFRTRAIYLYAVDVQTRKERWRFPIDELPYYVTGPILGNSKLYVVNDSYGDAYLYAINARNGKQEWDFTVPHGNSANSNLKSASNEPYSIYATRVFTTYYIPEAGINSLPAIEGNSAFVAINISSGIPDPRGPAFGNLIEYYLAALDTRTGKEKWRLKSDVEITSPVSIANGSVLFTSFFTKYLYGVNARTGELEWQFESEDRIVGVGTPITSEGVIYFADTKGTFYAVIPPLRVGMPTAGTPNQSSIAMLTIACAAIGLGLILVFILRPGTSRRS